MDAQICCRRSPDCVSSRECCVRFGLEKFIFNLSSHYPKGHETRPTFRAWVPSGEN
jgi:hypothetical protein